jgi:hypothetical protein
MKNKFRNDHRLCSDMGLIPVKINKSNNLKIIKNNKKIFNKFDETNNGVISNCSVLLKSNNKSKKGGALLSNSSDCRIEVTEYCNKIQDIINTLHFHNTGYENTYMYEFITYIINNLDKNDEELIALLKPIFINIPIKLMNFFINEFRTKTIKETACDPSNFEDEKCRAFKNEYDDITIEIDYSKYNSNITRKEIDNTTEIIKFEHSGYNKDIVCAYEQKYIDNINEMHEFITMQKNHVDRMKFSDKIIINDYSEYNTFLLYHYYINKGTDANWLNKYRTKVPDDRGDRNEDPFHFGDSYYKQIFSEFPEIFINKINSDPRITKIVDRSGTIKNFISIDEFWSTNGEKRIMQRDEISIFSDLTQQQWERVIAKFIKDVNKIILKSPKLIKDIYCYRGSTIHYIKHDSNDFCNGVKTNAEAIDSDYFLSSRLSSYSLNFDRSYEYLMKSKKKNERCIYRTVIVKDTPVLFIPQISDAPTELEILTPLNCLISYRKYESGISEPFNRYSYNNRHMKYGICSIDNFNSADIIINPPSSIIDMSKYTTDEIEAFEHIYSADGQIKWCNPKIYTGRQMTKQEVVVL